MHKFINTTASTQSYHNKKTTTVVARLFAAFTKAQYAEEIYYDFLIKTLELMDQLIFVL